LKNKKCNRYWRPSTCLRNTGSHNQSWRHWLYVMQY